MLEADGGTRTASITGAYVALVDALRASEKIIPCGALALTSQVAAISVGIVDDEPRLDLDYAEDSTAHVDMNIVMTGTGGFVEVQGTAERGTVESLALESMLALGRKGIQELLSLQNLSLASSGR